MKFFILSLLLFVSGGCQDTSIITGKIHVNIKNTYSAPPKIYGVRIEHNQLIVTGKNLKGVSVAKIEGSNNHNFQIESKTDERLVLNAKNALTLLVDGTFNLIVSNASASATFPITVELPSMGAAAGQYLRFNGTNWVPASITNTQIFAGSYDASTDSPDIVALGGTAGSYYIVTVAGIQDLGSGPESFGVGDWVIFNGSSWIKLEAQATGGVTGFNGRTGAVVPLNGDYSWSMLTKAAGKLTGSKLSEIADVDVTGIQDGDVIQWNATDSKWEALPAPSPTITNGSITTTHIADSAIDSDKIIDGSIVNADVSATAAIAQSKIAGLTTALSNKEPTIPTGTVNDYVRGDKTLGSFSSSFLNTVLTGYGVGTAIPITPLDTINQALGKLEAKDAAIITSQASYVPLDGTGVMTGNLQLGGKLITNLGDPSGNSDAANKKYVDDKVAAIGAGTTQWTTSGSDIYYDTGRVGIGTSSPASKLHLVSGASLSPSTNANSPLVIEGTTSNGNVNIQLISGNTRSTSILFADPDSSSGAGYSGAVMYDHGTDKMSFRTGVVAVDRLLIDSSGNVGIGTTTPDASAALDVTSTSSGFLLPRMTTAQRNAIPSPANGLMVYDTDMKSLFVYQATVWRQVGGSTHEFRATQVSAAATFPSGTATDVIYTNEEYDVSNSYNVTNGTYTVPEDGTYYFSWAIYLSNVGKLHTRNSELWVDGVVKARSSEVITTGANEGALNGSTILRLSAGQVVRVRAFGISSDASSVVASANTANQVWNFSGARMGGAGGQAGSDNLGNHLATQNLNLGIYKLVGNGGTSGLSISSSGNVGIGTTSPIATLHVNGGIYSGAISTAGTVYQTSSGIANGTNGRVDSSGSNSTACYNGAWGFWGYCTSLRSTKKDIKDLNLGLNTVLKMRPVSFVWKNNNQEDLGFIAEEIEKVDPLMAEYSKGKLSGVKYSSLTSLLTKAIQEFYSEFTGQREELERLKKENAEMKARLAKIEAMLEKK